MLISIALTQFELAMFLHKQCSDLFTPTFKCMHHIPPFVHFVTMLLCVCVYIAKVLEAA